MCKMTISPGVFFIFWAVRGRGWGGGVKGQKIAQNEKQQLHLSHAISQEQCSI